MFTLSQPVESPLSIASKEKNCAVTAVLDACRLCQSVQSTLLSAESIAKQDQSPVTVADFGAQAVIGLRLQDAFPDLPLMGEESALLLRQDSSREVKEKVLKQVRALRPGIAEAEMLDAIDRGAFDGGARGRFWVVDPIDGTKGFLRGEQYAVALALIENGQVVLGVLGCPSLPLRAHEPDGPRGCLFIAAAGEGAWVRSLADSTEQPLRVAATRATAEAVLCESVEPGHSAHGASARVAQQLGITRPPVRIDSQCKYAVIARGDATVYLRLPSRRAYRHKIWDHAAGALLVREAGGEVTGIRGEPLDFSLGRDLERNAGMIVTNGFLHARVVDAVQAVLASP